MAYAVGDTISNSDYNGLLNNTASGTPNAGVAARGINYIAGTGAGAYGLGQTQLNSVGSADVIQAAQWNSLFTFMNNIENHTNITALTSTTAVAAGDIIALKAALETDLNALAAAVAGGSTAATALTTTGILQAQAATSAWYTSFTSTFTVTFSSADQMRWFFNAGGKVRIVGARTGNGNSGSAPNANSANNKDLSWDSIYGALGNLDIGAQISTRSGTGETLTTDGLANGFHDLSANGPSGTTIIRITELSSPYNTNYLKIDAYLDAAVGTAVTMTIKVAAIDDAADATYTPTNPTANDAVDRNGIHTHTLYTINPTTAQGLATVYTPSGTTKSGSTVVGP
jgi:hypothetical protein